MKSFIAAVAVVCFCFAAVAGIGIHTSIQWAADEARQDEAAKWVVKYTPKQLSDENI